MLIGEGEMCKVTDFGMARDVQEDNIYQRKSKVPNDFKLIIMLKLMQICMSVCGFNFT